MCGIAGFWDKTANEQVAVGQTIFKMLQALGCRGPDSAGVALYGPAHAGALVLRARGRSHRGSRGMRQIPSATWRPPPPS